MRIISNIYLNHHILSGRPWEPPITVGTEFVCDNRKMFVVLTNYLAASSSLRGHRNLFTGFLRKRFFWGKANKTSSTGTRAMAIFGPCSSAIRNVKHLFITIKSADGVYLEVSSRVASPDDNRTMFLSLTQSLRLLSSLFFRKNGNIKKLIITFRLVCRHLVDDRDTRREGDEK